MIEPVVATALITSILALIAYYLQPQQPHHQSYYYHQIRRARVMADPQRRSRAGDVDRGAERRGSEWEVYEREHEEEGRETGEWAIGVREFGLIGRGAVGRRLILEGSVDAGDEKRLGVKVTGECHGSGVDSVHVTVDFGPEDVSAQEPDVHTSIGLQRSPLPIICLTTPNSDVPSTILPSHDAEHDAIFEQQYDNTLDQQRRQRVRFDEALRMHSYGGSQYVGRVVGTDEEMRKGMKKER